MLTFILALSLFATSPKTETPAPQPKEKQTMVWQPMLHTKVRYFGFTVRG